MRCFRNTDSRNTKGMGRRSITPASKNPVCVLYTERAFFIHMCLPPLQCERCSVCFCVGFRSDKRLPRRLSFFDVGNCNRMRRCCAFVELQHLSEERLQ